MLRKQSDRFRHDFHLLLLILYLKFSLFKCKGMSKASVGKKKMTILLEVLMHSTIFIIFILSNNSLDQN